MKKTGTWSWAAGMHKQVHFYRVVRGSLKSFTRKGHEGYTESVASEFCRYLNSR